MTINLTDQDKTTLRVAAYGAVSLLAAAGDKPHKIATNGTMALTSATGVVGHVLNEKRGTIPLKGKNVAEMADQVLPALKDAVTLLETHSPAEAENFRTTITIALEAAKLHQATPSPVLTEMTRKITESLV